ncbi:MAG TPA: LD-carboxypeptidase [Alphaproteobacteria bacterium]
MTLSKPKALTSDSHIMVVAPGGWSEPAYLEQCVQNAQERYNLRITLHPQCYLREGNSAGSTADKIKAFNEAWQDPTVDAIFTARGGSRSLHLLDGLDWDMIRQQPKILLGFSDVTVLLNTLYKQTSIPGFHGPLLSMFHPDSTTQTARETLALLRGHWEDPLFPLQHNFTTLRPGEAQGPLIGGNLCMIYALSAAGQTYAPIWQDKILLIEDIDEDIRYLDRMLGALRLRGVFKQIKGLVCGQFTGITDTSTYPFGRTFEQLIIEHVLPDLQGPVVLNAPFGHTPGNYPFPVGTPAILKANGQVSLHLTESPFAEAKK